MLFVTFYFVAIITESLCSYLNHETFGNITAFNESDFVINSTVEARTEVGWGDPSQPIMITTDAGIPEAPNNLRRMSRTESCLKLSWVEPSVTNGEIIKYEVSYRALEISSSSNSEPVFLTKEVEGTERETTLCNLFPASRYIISLAASTSKGYGASTSIQTYTEVGQPPRPPAPLVDEISATNVTIIIQPAVLTKGPVTSYYVIVDKITERRKRQTVDPTSLLGLNGYVTAGILPTLVLGSRKFVVGDNTTFGGYKNLPLTRETSYNVYYVVSSSIDGVTKMNYSSLAQPVTTLATQAPTSGQVASSDTTFAWWWWILIAFAVLLLIAIIVILVWCCCLRKNKEDDSNNTLKQTWLNLYQQKYADDTLKLEKKAIWSDIDDLHNSRRITIHDETTYRTNDLQVADIQRKDSRNLLTFEQEYNQLPKGLTSDITEAQKPANSERNRFDEKFLPYDHSRVVLKDSKSNNYINASYIHGYKAKNNAYIAAASPFNDVTIKDFWSMVYQEGVSQIVCLIRIQESSKAKGVQYWPDLEMSGHYVKYGRLEVMLKQTYMFANFDVRKMLIRRSERSRERTVILYQYLAWPEHGVPEDPLPFLEFRMKVEKDRRKDPDLEHAQPAPVLVHCGTGVSQSALFIALDSLMQQAKEENCVNVYSFANMMRKQRPMMIRTCKQYKFLYDLLFEALITNYNIVGADLKVKYRLLSNTNPITDKTYIREQFEDLEQYLPSLTDERCSVASLPKNQTKNRFQTIIPSDADRVPLKTPKSLEKENYINALFFDSYSKQDNIIVTQTPLLETVNDFWKLIYDYDVNTIVMMNGESFKEDTCAQYWPRRRGLDKYDPFFVTLDRSEETEFATIRIMFLKNSQQPDEQPREVRMFQFKSWKMYEKVPWSREAFINFIEDVDLWREHSDTMDVPQVVHCMDGASQSGLYVACSLLMEKIDWEDEVDVFHTIKHIKRRRPHFINSVEQYKFCFKYLWDFYNTRIHGLKRATGEPFEPGADVELPSP